MLSITGCQFCVAQGNIIGRINILPMCAWGSVENLRATCVLLTLSPQCRVCREEDKVDFGNKCNIHGTLRNEDLDLYGIRREVRVLRVRQFQIRAGWEKSSQHIHIDGFLVWVCEYKVCEEVS